MDRFSESWLTPTPKRKESDMLTLTENAATAVTSIVTGAQGGPDAGLRIREAAEPATGFELGISSNPEPQDAVVEVSGARVFLDEDAAALLDDRVLDAEVAQDGGVRFALVTQA
jgi:iron-sulfur cluster assembly protein